jgi:hypothetical protein
MKKYNILVRAGGREIRLTIKEMKRGPAARMIRISADEEFFHG